MNPNSLKAIEGKGFKAGVSGNPSGLPGTDLPALIARRAFEADPESVINALRSKLTAADIQAFKELADRGYGKVKDRVEHTGPDGGPVEHTIRFGTDKK